MGYGDAERAFDVDLDVQPLVAVDQVRVLPAEERVPAQRRNLHGCPRGPLRTGVLGVLTLGHFRPPIKSCAARLPSGRARTAWHPTAARHALARAAAAGVGMERASERGERGGGVSYAVALDGHAARFHPHIAEALPVRANRRAAAGPSPTGSSSDERSTHRVRPSGRGALRGWGGFVLGGLGISGLGFRVSERLPVFCVYTQT
jgi:hypothetical protein